MWCQGKQVLTGTCRIVSPSPSEILPKLINHFRRYIRLVYDEYLAWRGTMKWNRQNSTVSPGRATRPCIVLKWARPLIERCKGGEHTSGLVDALILIQQNSDNVTLRSIAWHISQQFHLFIVADIIRLSLQLRLMSQQYLLTFLSSGLWLSFTPLSQSLHISLYQKIQNSTRAASTWKLLRNSISWALSLQLLGLHW